MSRWTLYSLNHEHSCWFFEYWRLYLYSYLDRQNALLVRWGLRSLVNLEKWFFFALTLILLLPLYCNSPGNPLAPLSPCGPIKRRKIPLFSFSHMEFRYFISTFKFQFRISLNVTRVYVPGNPMGPLIPRFPLGPSAPAGPGVPLGPLTPASPLIPVSPIKIINVDYQVSFEQSFCWSYSFRWI